MSTNSYPVFFDSTGLSTVQNQLYQVPTSPTTITLQEAQLKVINHGDATRQVTLYAIPAAESTSDEYQIAPGMTVPAHDYVIVPCPRLGAGGTLEGFADQSGAIAVQPLGGKLHTP